VANVFGEYWTAGDGAAAAERTLSATRHARAPSRCMPVYRWRLRSPRWLRPQHQTKDARSPRRSAPEDRGSVTREQRPPATVDVTPISPSTAV
jgi:hypothetical protein